MNLTKINLTAFSLILAIFPSVSTLGQGFDFVSAELGVVIYNSVPEYGAGVTVYDFDGDGWDDLTFCMNQDSIKLFRNNEGSFEIFPSPLFSDYDAKHAIWVDYDNDGDSDLFVTRNNGPNILLRNDGTMSFTDVSDFSGIDPDNTASTYGCAWGDYNLDGWLDLYVCNYNWLDGVTNWLMRNNGDGTFTETGLELGLDNASLPSFQAVWIDYNNDGWPDLHLINDKVPTNSLYRNNTDGTFSDMSAPSGAGLSFEAMSNSVCDYNHDGYLDIYMTNNSSGNKLLKNNGNSTFTEWASIAGLQVMALSWGATWIDYDNNTWDDLYVATDYMLLANQNFFFEKNEDETFSLNLGLGFVNDSAPSFSNAKGDFNNDGFADFVVTSEDPFPAKLWQNVGVGGNYVKVSLEGSISNRDAIGSWIRYYMEGDEYVSYTMCGEGYLAQNSQYKILGLDDKLSIDSLIITWPSGMAEGFYDLGANQSFHFIEGQSLTANLNYNGSITVCADDTLVLSINQEFTEYLWSTGEDTAQITPISSGSYWVTATNEIGITIQSDTVVIEFLNAIEYSIQSSHPICFGYETGIIALAFSGDVEVDSVIFEFGGIGLFQGDLGAGIYPFIIIDEEGCHYEDSFELLQPDSLGANIEITDVNCFSGEDGEVSFEVFGGTPPYSTDWSGVDTEGLPAGTYTLFIEDESGCTKNVPVVIQQPEDLEGLITVEGAPEGAMGSAEVEIVGGTEPYNILWSNGLSGLEAEFEAGMHSVWVIDANGCAIFLEFEIETIVGIHASPNSDIKVYPNPFTNTFSLNSSAAATLTITDELGRLVNFSHIQKGLNNVDAGAWSAGIYLAVINFGTSRGHFRLIRAPQ